MGYLVYTLRSRLLFDEGQQLLDLVLGAEPDAASLVNLLWSQVQDALTLVVDSHAAGLLEQEGHWKTLVQDTQLAGLGLGVGRVAEDATVQQRSVDVGHHGADVSGAVGLVVVVGLGLLQGGNVLLDVVAPVVRVPLVDGVDLLVAAVVELQVRVGQDELAQVRV